MLKASPSKRKINKGRSGFTLKRSRNGRLWKKHQPPGWLVEPKQKLLWLVVSTPLKNISQLGWLFPIFGKIRNVPNHQPVLVEAHTPKKKESEASVPASRQEPGLSHASKRSGSSFRTSQRLGRPFSAQRLVERDIPYKVAPRTFLSIILVPNISVSIQIIPFYSKYIIIFHPYFV